MNKKQRHGFSLVEVMAAVVVVGVMAASVMNMYSFGGRANLIAQQQLALTGLFTYKVEEIKCQAFAKDVTVAGQVISSFPNYLIDVTQTTPYLSNTYLKKIDVTCRYTSLFGTSKIEKVSFLVANMD